MRAQNRYGRTKLMIERPNRREPPRGLPNNLLSFIAKVAVGRLHGLRVFGDDYDTAEGTGVRVFVRGDTGDRRGIPA